MIKKGFLLATTLLVSSYQLNAEREELERGRRDKRIHEEKRPEKEFSVVNFGWQFTKAWGMFSAVDLVSKKFDHYYIDDHYSAEELEGFYGLGGRAISSVLDPLVIGKALVIASACTFGPQEDLDTVSFGEKDSINALFSNNKANFLMALGGLATHFTSSGNLQGSIESLKGGLEKQIRKLNGWLLKKAGDSDLRKVALVNILIGSLTNMINTINAEVLRHPRRLFRNAVFLYWVAAILNTRAELTQK